MSGRFIIILTVIQLKSETCFSYVAVTVAGTERGPTKLTYRLLSPRLGVRFDFI